VKIIFDSDIPQEAQLEIKEIINESLSEKCKCGCDEIYVSLIDESTIDVKCYDCGASFFELEIEAEEEASDEA
jgi:hypothetical protein